MRKVMESFTNGYLSKHLVPRRETHNESLFFFIMGANVTFTTRLLRGGVRLGYARPGMKGPTIRNSSMVERRAMTEQLAVVSRRLKTETRVRSS